MKIFCFDRPYLIRKHFFFFFFVSVFCFQVLTRKLNLRLKIGLTYAISMVKLLFFCLFFFNFLSEKYFNFHLLNLNY